VSDDTIRERIVLETDRYRIAGEVTLPAEGFHSRVSDLLNRKGLTFVAVSNATISSLNGGGTEERSFIAVARDHIQVAYEDES
jgi:hypothetical protein